MSNDDLDAGIVGRPELKRQLANLLGQDKPPSDRTITRWETLGLPVVRRGRLRLYEIEAARAWLLGKQRMGARK